jgi:hypothetical protein
MPRVAGVSGSSTLWVSRRRHLPSTVFAWVLLNPIVLLRSVTVRRFADLVPGGTRPVKVLARGELAKRFTVRAHKFSGKAAEKIAAAGGATEVIG